MTSWFLLAAAAGHMAWMQPSCVVLPVGSRYSSGSAQVSCAHTQVEKRNTQIESETGKDTPTGVDKFSISPWELIITCTCMLKSLQSWSTLCDPRLKHTKAPLSMGVSRQECWSGLPFPSPGNLPNPGIELVSLYVCLHWQPSSLSLVPPGKYPLSPDKKVTQVQDPFLGCRYEWKDCIQRLPFPMRSMWKNIYIYLELSR